MEEDVAVYASTIGPISPSDIQTGSPETSNESGISNTPVRNRTKSIVQTKTVTSTTQDTLIEEKGKGKKWHVNGMGHVIYKDHNSYTLMKQIQMGIRTTISTVTNKRDREVKLKDINHIEKLDFPNKGSLRTPPHNFEHFKFYDYAPWAFRHLRERFGIKAEHLLVSLCHDKSLSILGTPGKSGALFFFSADMEFILKTVTKKESKFLRRILPQYYNHVMTNPSTLITRFYGLYSIKPKNNKLNNVRFIIMNNVFDTQLFVEERYDLKGSTVGRHASEKERKRETPILKDLDFLDANRKLKIGNEMKQKILKQLESDCKFLQEMNIMDYSILLGCHKLTEEDAEVLEAYQKKKASPIPIDDKSTLTVPNLGASVQPDYNLNSEHDGNAQDIPLISVDKDNAPIISEGSASSSANNARILQNVTQSETSQPSSPQNPRASITAVDLFKIFKVGNTEMHLSKHFQGEKTSEFQRFHGGILSEPLDEKGTREIYFIGIIDLLQAWTNVKIMENVFKGLKYDRKQISAVNPKSYAARFQHFVGSMLV